MLNKNKMSDSTTFDKKMNIAVSTQSVEIAREGMEQAYNGEAKKQKSIQDVIDFAQLIKFSEDGPKHSSADRIKYLNKLGREDKLKLLQDIEQRIKDQGFDSENKEYMFFALDEIIEEDNALSLILSRLEPKAELAVDEDYKNSVLELQSSLNEVKCDTPSESNIVKLLLAAIAEDDFKGIFDTVKLSKSFSINKDLSEIISKSLFFAEKLKQGYADEINRYRVDETIEIKDKLIYLFQKNIKTLGITFDEAVETANKDMMALIDFIDAIGDIDDNPANLVLDSMALEDRKTVCKLLIDHFTANKNTSKEQKKQILTACINSVESMGRIGR